MQKVPIIATYALLFVLGVLEGMIGSFQYSRGPAPLAAIGFCLLLVATCLLAAWGMRGTLAALIPALGWIIAAYVMSQPTPGGSVIITNTTAGKWYLYGGTLCAAIAVAAAFRLWLGYTRQQSQHRSPLPRRVRRGWRGRTGRAARPAKMTGGLLSPLSRLVVARRRPGDDVQPVVGIDECDE